MSAIQQMLLAGGGVRGQQEYATAGTFTWVCPAGVTSVCAVAIGPGRSATGAATSARNGGPGGGLGYRNNIAVTPGFSYTVVVGAVDTATDSYFIDIAIVKGGAASSTTAGTYTGEGGGNGGARGTGATFFDGTGGTYYLGGGGGASGSYLGNGGNGANASTSGTQNIGTTGGQGIKGGNGGFTGAQRAGDGGGGALTNGTVLTTGLPGGDPNGGNGTGYGSGGGGGHRYDLVGNQQYSGANGLGRSGAVRIIWGEGRAFPSTNVEDV